MWWSREAAFTQYEFAEKLVNAVGVTAHHISQLR
jgi:hypothetical protein